MASFLFAVAFVIGVLLAFFVSRQKEACLCVAAPTTGTGRSVPNARRMVAAAALAVFLIAGCAPLAASADDGPQSEVVGAISAVLDGGGSAEGSGEPQHGALSVYFLNVGQGDAEFLVLPNGQTMLIDAGTADSGQAVVSYIQGLGYGRIDYLIATHPHEDHIGGMPAVFATFDVGQVWAPEAYHDTQAFESFLDAVEAEGLTINAAVAGSRIFDANGCTIDILSPASGASYDDLNDWSAVLKVTYGVNSWLFTGDASATVLESLGIGHVDMLKVPHHGSDTGTTPELLNQLTPVAAVIEVGSGNDYGHPTQETVGELVAANVQIWRTDLDGTVLSVSDGTAMANSSADTGASAPAPSEQTEAAVASRQEEAQAAQAAAEAQAQAAAAAQQAQAVQAADPASQVVYITNTGEKYHRDGCRYLKSRIETTLGAAVAQGYEPCKVCNPPTL